MVRKSLLLGLILILFSGCNKIAQVRGKIKRAIFGPKTENVVEEVVEEEDSGVPEFKASERVDKITPKNKVINLMRAYTQAGDQTFLPLLTKSIETDASLFSGKMDKELISSIYKLEALIESGSQEALDIAYMWYLKLDGENKKETERVVATGFDHQTYQMFSSYARDIEGSSCQLVLVPPPRTLEAESKAAMLNSRRVILKEFQQTTNMDERMFDLINKCVDTLEFALKSY